MAPSEALKREGVHIVSLGVCPEVSDDELCNVSSPPKCQNAVLMKTTQPPDGPASELADKVKNCKQILKH